MSAREMKFLKGAGKAFEIVRTLANWVLVHGGSEEHVLRILQPPDKDPVASQIGRLLVRSAIDIVKRPPQEIVMDEGAGYYTRLKVLKDAGSVELAMTLLRSGRAYCDLGIEAVDLIAFNAKGNQREELLLEVALMLGPGAATAASNATLLLDKQISQGYLLQIARGAFSPDTRRYAVQVLDEEHLKAAATCEHWEVRSEVAERISDLPTLQSLQQDPNQMVRDKATMRLAGLEETKK